MNINNTANNYSDQMSFENVIYMKEENCNST